ncbi:formylglycine-generating enzyme family protein [Prosthecochloris vibrioformis]|uniref:Formylglycine-generating enzyme family protein n=1 Tax=Prosthecochloris vibrioformis TaxID=1098 RepID=A0A5C4RSI2_PROVB|nr:SUMF1/EgtB/PvdO family nonheme iron enzyme [Prosthecochloris vibrioformis]TNJ34156.1 formylglycine-generating enzyme family protein [Prosthecochloris vibrioformis]
MTAPMCNDTLAELRSRAIRPSSEELPPVIINEQDGSPMVLVPAGKFLMGDDLDKESPQRSLWLDAFYISVYAVTNRQYRAFIAATGHQPPNIGARIDSLSFWRDEGCPEEFDDYPVVLISWDDADAYARWAGCQLPDEAQWEKAARGPEGFLYPWGDKWDENNCRHRNNKGEDSVAPVYAYPEGVSGYGTWNQGGNIMEWCSVLQGEGENGAYPEGDDALRQERGGCWRYPDKFAFRASQRSFVVSKAVNDFRGFRLVLPVKGR